METYKGLIHPDYICGRISGKKILIVLCVILAFTLYIINIHMTFIFPKDFSFYKQQHEREQKKQQYNFNVKFTLNTTGCKIPFLDPVHSSVSHLIKYKGQLVCDGKKPIVIPDRDIKNPGLIFMQKNLLVSKNNITCGYYSLYRKSEHISVYGQKRYFNTSRVNVTDEYIKVECIEPAYKTVIFQDYFPFIQRKEDVEKRVRSSNISKEKDKSQRLSIILLGIDSLSKNQYVRHMLKTDAYMRNHTTFIEMFGYNKIGKNTYPNMVAMLTGHPASELEDTSKKYVNLLPLIWNDFAKLGYRTLFSEDKPTVTMFNYGRKGFLHQPTDYYLRPFNIALESSDVIKKGKKGCINHRIEADVLLNYTGDFFDAFPDEPLFSLTFFKRLSHDYINEVAFHDEPFKRFLQRLHDSGHLNRSFVFFFGDHGFRFGTIRKTYIGRVEGKLPFMAVLVPPWFPSKYPKFFANLKANSKRLTSALDIFATINGILHFPEEVKSDSPQPQSRSMNLFKSVISENRTCEEANIPFHFCSCVQFRKVIPSEEKVVKAAKKMVEKINEFTKKHRYFCSELELNEVSEAAVQMVHLGETSAENASTNYQLIVRVRPSQGLFEGTVWHFIEKDEFVAHSDIERINLYGNQSYCINIAPIKPFCYCKRI